MIIKLFENFDEKLYQEVESWERNPKPEFMKRMVNISTSDANLILKSIDRSEFILSLLPVTDIDYSKKELGIPECLFRYNYLVLRPSKKSQWDNDYIKLEIYEDDDEWFWVKMETYGDDLFFKCDQMDGLIQFLKEYNIIK